MFQKCTNTTQKKDCLTLSLILGLGQHSLLGCHQDLSILKHANEATQFLINMCSVIFITMFATYKIHLCLHLYGAHTKVVVDALSLETLKVRLGGALSNII